jgi:exosortase H (IPTLxxWG-CTERM-specific)
MNRKFKSRQDRAATRTESRLKAWWRSKGPVLRFGISFAILVAAYYAIAVTDVFDHLLVRLLHWNALASCALLNLFGQDCHISDTYIRSQKFAVNIRRGCDAAEPVWFFVAAVLSFPAPVRSKLAGITVGAALITAANILRISSLFMIGAYFPQFFPTAHLEIWPAMLIVLAAVLWIAWLVRLRRRAVHEQV